MCSSWYSTWALCGDPLRRFSSTSCSRTSRRKTLLCINQRRSTRSTTLVASSLERSAWLMIRLARYLNSSSTICETTCRSMIRGRRKRIIMMDCIRFTRISIICYKPSCTSCVSDSKQSLSRLETHSWFSRCLRYSNKHARTSMHSCSSHRQFKQFLLMSVRRMDTLSSWRLLKTLWKYFTLMDSNR